MAWDFETDPEFEQQLVWMREFIDREIVPLEPILDEKIDSGEWAAGQAPPAGPGQGAGSVGGVPRSQTRRIRLRSAQACVDVGDHRPQHGLDGHLRRAGTRQRQHGADGPRRHRGAEAALAVAEPAGGHHQCVRTHRAVPRGRRPDRDRHDSDARRRPLDHQRPQVVHRRTHRAPTSCSSSRRPTPKADRTGTRRSSWCRPAHRA